MDTSWEVDEAKIHEIALNYRLFQAGANMIVSGTAVVKSEDPGDVMDLMRRSVRDEIVKRVV